MGSYLGSLLDDTGVDGELPPSLLDDTVGDGELPDGVFGTIGKGDNHQLLDEDSHDMIDPTIPTSAPTVRITMVLTMVQAFGGETAASVEGFDSKQKVARGAVERAFDRLKGMWLLFLQTHKTNLDTLPQQFTAVCILHNILINAEIPFDENLLWEVDANCVRRCGSGDLRAP
ncbi:hypothetical protein CBR_g37515 [Chara braunii]|uniref:DDE Tnp4 domain-containing protein n=1 Tax=Chara braunii TaxID=69332 RepID=A0A388LN50_CHABU|nr:hypothetical protein CBR_g37515 [Chara braunii]|eukprot:GBG83714.1 hypothetical protein CBR_g37515 [Chara braunii]